MTAQIIEFKPYRLRKFAKKYAALYLQEGQNYANTFARKEMSAEDRKQAIPYIKKEMRKLREIGKK